MLSIKNIELQVSAKARVLNQTLSNCKVLGVNYWPKWGVYLPVKDHPLTEGGFEATQSARVIKECFMEGEDEGGFCRLRGGVSEEVQGQSEHEDSRRCPSPLISS